VLAYYQFAMQQQLHVMWKHSPNASFSSPNASFSSPNASFAHSPIISHTQDGGEEELAFTFHTAGADFMKKVARPRKKSFTADTFGASVVHSSRSSSGTDLNTTNLPDMDMHIEPWKDGQALVTSVNPLNLPGKGSQAFCMVLPKGWGSAFLDDDQVCTAVAYLTAAAAAGAGTCVCALVSLACDALLTRELVPQHMSVTLLWMQLILVSASTAVRRRALRHAY
jgi:hypothetical protein